MNPFSARNMRIVNRAAQVLSLVSLAVSVPIGVFQYRRARTAELQAAIDRTYDALDDRYVSFQTLCMQYVKLDCYDRPLTRAVLLSSADSVQQKLMYTILLSMLERAFIQYKTKPMPSRKEQWLGWQDYAAAFPPRAAFRATWQEVRHEYDTRFRDFMDSVITAAARPR